MKYNIKLCFMNLEVSEGGKSMILRKKKRIKELEKEVKRLKKIVIKQEEMICQQRLSMTFHRMNGSD